MGSNNEIAGRQSWQNHGGRARAVSITRSSNGSETFRNLDHVYVRASLHLIEFGYSSTSFLVTCNFASPPVIQKAHEHMNTEIELCLHGH